MKARITAKYYEEAARFTTHNPSRYSLAAVRIEPHPTQGALIIATDGHTMIIIHDVNGECSEAVTLTYSKRATRWCKHGTELTVNDDNSVTVACVVVVNSERRTTNLVTFFDLFESGAFPAWRLCLPAEEGKRSEYNAGYLQRCGSLDERGFDRIAMWSSSPDRAAIIRIADRDDVTCVVMPNRDLRTHYPSDLFKALRTSQGFDTDKPSNQVVDTTENAAGSME